MKTVKEIKEALKNNCFGVFYSPDYNNDYYIFNVRKHKGRLQVRVNSNLTNGQIWLDVKKSGKIYQQ